jgi:O-antigen ligase
MVSSGTTSASNPPWSPPRYLFYLLLVGLGSFFLGRIALGSISLNFWYITIAVCLLLPLLLLVAAFRAGKQGQIIFLYDRHALLVLLAVFPSLLVCGYSIRTWVITYLCLSIYTSYRIGKELMRDPTSGKIKRSRIIAIYRTMLAGGLYICCYGLAQFYLKGLRAIPPLHFPGVVYRLYETLPVFYNLTATLLLVLIPMAYGLNRLSHSWWEKVSMCLIMGIFILTLFLSYSRGSWLAFGVLLTVFAAHQRKLMPLVILALIAMGIFCFGPMHLSERLKTVVSFDYLTNLKRVQYWHAAICMILERPFTGFGLGSFQTWSPFYALNPGFTPPVTPHNLYLHIAAELGLPALIIFLALLAQTLQRCWHLTRTSFIAEERVTNLVGLLGFSALAFYFLVDF